VRVEWGRESFVQDQPMDENVSEIAIVDYGRGMQLSTKRITVQDLVPYFQGGSSYGEIIRWIPCCSMRKSRLQSGTIGTISASLTTQR